MVRDVGVKFRWNPFFFKYTPKVHREKFFENKSFRVYCLPFLHLPSLKLIAFSLSLSLSLSLPLKFLRLCFFLSTRRIKNVLGKSVGLKGSSYRNFDG